MGDGRSNHASAEDFAMIYLLLLSCTDRSMIRDTSREGDGKTQDFLLPWNIEPDISQDDQYVQFEIKAQRKSDKI